MQPRFRIMRVIATLFIVLAWLSLLLTISYAVVVTASVAGLSVDYRITLFSSLDGVAAGIATILAGIGAFIVLYVVGGGISLIIAIEENTRATTEYLRTRPGPPVRF